MQAFVQRRRDGQPGPAAEEPAGPPPTALLLPHHGKAKSAPPLGVAAADWGPEGDGMGAGNGRGRGRGRALKWGASLALLLLLLLRYHPEGRGHTHTAFVTVEDTRFMLDCRPFYIAGFNVETIGQLAHRDFAGPAGLRGGAVLGKAVRAVFEQTAAAGLNVVRTFAHTTETKHPLQVEPGVYDEAVFRGLDVVIAEAERAGLRVILSLADNWKRRGGVDEYVDWSETAPPRDEQFPPVVDSSGDVSTEGYTPEQRAYENRRKSLFFKDEGCRHMYKDHMRTVLERRNTVSGRAYKDDPTILGFNLLNELRCSSYEVPGCTDLVTKWVLEMAQHFKSLDQRHLLTVGSEGFWGERDAMRSLNPGMPVSDWASKAGQDWIANHALPQIDFAAYHIWSDNWANHNATFHRLWVDQHVEDCKTMLKKPCLLEEFGKKLPPGNTRNGAPTASAISELRDPLYENMYSTVEAGIAQGTPQAGSLFWRLGTDAFMRNWPGEYGVLPEHSTFKLVTRHAQLVRAYMLGAAPREQCGLDCWTPAAHLGGLLRRCEHRPSACADRRARAQYQKPAAGAGAQLQPASPQVFASQAECCLPGLGGFRQGCSATWF
ncbi:hypothetical protein ABPG77_004865 [Micractinium sp. CCAP 211/92]